MSLLTFLRDLFILDTLLPNKKRPDTHSFQAPSDNHYEDYYEDELDDDLF